MWYLLGKNKFVDWGVPLGVIFVGAENSGREF